MTTTSSRSEDRKFLTLLLEVLGVKNPGGNIHLPIDLIVDGYLAIQVYRHRQQWIISGIIAREISHCEDAALSQLMSHASRDYGDPSIMSYEKSRDALILWRTIQHRHQENLESDIDLFLKELEFWRREATEAGCVGRDSFFL